MNIFGCDRLLWVLCRQALGLVSAGTNNSRVAQLLRQLSEFYAREASHLFVTRIAQGLNHMGKVRTARALYDIAFRIRCGRFLVCIEKPCLSCVCLRYYKKHSFEGMSVEGNTSVGPREGEFRSPLCFPARPESQHTPVFISLTSPARFHSIHRLPFAVFHPEKASSELLSLLFGAPPLC